MTTREWYKIHEGWLGALMLFVGAFSIGILTATILGRESCTKQIDSLTTGFNTLIQQKDGIITRLSASTVNASNAAVKASDVAVKASQEDTKDAGKH